MPIPREPLYLYLAASEYAVSAVLIKEDSGVHKPVYYVSRALHGPEQRYLPIEKLVLALVHAARRLRPYFQAHPICVLTNQNLKQVLLKPEASGRLQKWAIELGEHDISYIPRRAIKGQVLADFLAEITGPAPISVPSAAQPPKKRRYTDPNLWTLFVDGASSTDGAGAGLLIVDPSGVEVTYALRFDFPASNNEAEYEALIAGLQIAHRLGARRLQAYGDSQLIANQILGSYQAKDPIMKKYLDKVHSLLPLFEFFCIDRIPRSQNRRADALSKLASSAYAHLTKKVLVEVLPQPSFDQQPILTVTDEQDTWMTPIIQYLSTGRVPPTSQAARSPRMKAAHYALHDGVLYKKGYLQPWLRCVGPNQALYVLQELHHGSCGSHAGARTLAQKAIRTGYFWPSIYRDADRLVKSCKNCQHHAPLTHLPQTELRSIQSPCPFYQWGIDIVGPFPEAPGRFRFLVVAVDYFTKWVEAEPLTTITGRNVLMFGRTLSAALEEPFEPFVNLTF